MKQNTACSPAKLTKTKRWEKMHFCQVVGEQEGKLVHLHKAAEQLSKLFIKKIYNSNKLRTI